ncbi:MAG: DNA-3-methyladenine glycosylase I [Planctomycetota bacterium]
MDDGRTRCPWCAQEPTLAGYHDTEWGFPVADDTRLFEKVCLEGFQSGLSWRTIYDKRENFRSAFAGFEIGAVARFGARDVKRLLGDAGIVRHRGKIEAAIHNAGRAEVLIEEFGSLGVYLWRYEPAPGSRPAEVTWEFLKTTAKTAESIALAKDLKKRGWKFVGPTTAYAFMQAMGLVNDHVAGCFVRERVAAAREGFAPPV